MVKEMGVYKIVLRETNKIIYIGKTKSNFRKRIAKHYKAMNEDRKFEPYIKLGCDVYIYHMDNPTQVDIMEKALIDKYKPLLNCAYNEMGSHPAIHVDELEWEKYDYSENDKVKYILSDYISRMIFEINGVVIEITGHDEYKDFKKWVRDFIKDIEKSTDEHYETYFAHWMRRHVPTYVHWEIKNGGTGFTTIMNRYSTDKCSFFNRGMILLKYIIFLNENNGKMTEKEYSDMLDYFNKYSEGPEDCINIIDIILKNGNKIK